MLPKKLTPRQAQIRFNSISSAIVSRQQRALDLIVLDQNDPKVKRLTTINNRILNSNLNEMLRFCAYSISPLAVDRTIDRLRQDLRDAEARTKAESKKEGK